MEHVIVIPCRSTDEGRAVLDSLIGLADDKAIELRAAAVVERHADGRWHFPEETENVSYAGTMTGGVLGALVGLLAGPAGLLLGGAAGLLIGSSAEIGDTEEVESVVHALPRLVAPGTTAVVADVWETSPAPVDDVVQALGTTAWRMNRNEAKDQVEAARSRLETTGPAE